MPKEWKDCVQALIKQGKSEDSAYAICTAQFKQKHGKNPTHMSDEDFDEFIESVKLEDIQAYSRDFDMPQQIMFSISEGVRLEDKDDEDDYEKNKKITIQVLRAGRFEHPEYGTIAFDGDTFKTFMKNFKMGIPQQHIAYDFKHRPDWGAAAWLKKLFVQDNKLFATVELTPRGYKSLKDKEFIYFSTEYNDGYKDRETGKNYGPTILGGGLTNRPFIKGMMPVLLSEGEEVIFSLAEYEKKKKKKGGGGGKSCHSDDNIPNKEGTMFKKLQELMENLKAKIAALQESDDGIQKEDLEEIQTSMKSLSEVVAGIKPEDVKDEEKGDEKLEELKDRVISLSERVGKIKVDDKNGDSKLEKFAKRFEIFEKKLGDIDFDENKVLAERNKELEDQVKKLQEGNKNLGASIKKLQERDEENQKKIYADGIKAFTKELSDSGFWPSVVKEAGAILEAYEGQNSTVVKLSEEEGEGDDKKKVEKELSLQDVISRILSAIPEDHRVDTSEKTKAAEKKGTKLSVEEIEEMAEKHKLSYGDMLIKLSEDPKYKDRIDW